MFKFVTAATIFGLAAADPEWAVASGGKYIASMAMGVTASSADGSEALVAAGSSNSGGFIMSTANAGGNFTTVPDSQGMAFMSIGADTETGNAVAGGMFATIYGNADGFQPAQISKMTITQSVEAVRGAKDNFVLAGTVGMKNAIAVSQDAGATWTTKTVPTQQPVRYVAAPSADVMYVTAGMWPVDDDSDQLDFSQYITRGTDGLLRLNIANGGTDDCHNYADQDTCDADSACTWCKSAAVPSSCYTMEEISALPPSIFACDASEETNSGSAGTGWSAEVWKTTNGGDDWEMVFSDYTTFYPNGIDCFDEDTCAFVAEGDATYVYMTTDGQTFSKMHEDDTAGASLMAVRMVSATEVHAMGGLIVSPGMKGTCWHTTDGGNTWDDIMGVKNLFIMAADFSDASHGYASAMTLTNMGDILRYE